MTSKQIGKLFKKGGKKGRKRGKRGKIGEKEGVRGGRWKGGKEEKKIPRKKKYRYGRQKMGNGKQKNDYFSFTILGSFLKSDMGRLSKSMEQYMYSMLQVLMHIHLQVCSWLWSESDDRFGKQPQ